MARETKATVFVVDDESPVRDALVYLIGSLGMHAESFATAQEFLDHPPVEGINCLVLDVRMPDMSGLELQARLAAQGRSLPIIFITGHGDVEMGVRAMKAGAVDFLQKPFNDQALLDAIHVALQRDAETRRHAHHRAEIRERLETLSGREREVFILVVSGRLNKQAALVLGLSETTVKVHRGNVMRKMKAHSLPELTRLAALCDLPLEAEQERPTG